MSTFQTGLAAHGACPQAVHWVENKDRDTAWRECERADWMLWLLEKEGVPMEQLRELVLMCISAAIIKLWDDIPPGIRDTFLETIQLYRREEGDAALRYLYRNNWYPTIPHPIARIRAALGNVSNPEASVNWIQDVVDCPKIIRTNYRGGTMIFQEKNQNLFSKSLLGRIRRQRSHFSWRAEAPPGWVLVRRKEGDEYRTVGCTTEEAYEKDPNAEPISKWRGLIETGVRIQNGKVLLVPGLCEEDDPEIAHRIRSRMCLPTITTKVRAVGVTNYPGEEGVIWTDDKDPMLRVIKKRDEKSPWRRDDPSKSPDLKPGEKIIICWEECGMYLAGCAEVLDGKIFYSSIMPYNTKNVIEWKKEWAWIPVPNLTEPQ